MWNKVFIGITLVVYIVVSEFIAYIYFSIFKGFQPVGLISPAAFASAQISYYTVGAVIGVLAFILVTIQVSISRKLDRLSQAHQAGKEKEKVNPPEAKKEEEKK